MDTTVDMLSIVTGAACGGIGLCVMFFVVWAIEKLARKEIGPGR